MYRMLQSLLRTLENDGDKDLPPLTLRVRIALECNVNGMRADMVGVYQGDNWLALVKRSSERYDFKTLRLCSV